MLLLFLLFPSCSLCSLVQYISRFVWYYLKKHGFSAEAVARFRKLEVAISTARKCKSSVCMCACVRACVRVGGCICMVWCRVVQSCAEAAAELISLMAIITVEPAHRKRGPTAFIVILRKSHSKIAVQNFTISEVCDFVFKSYGAAHGLPCFVELFNRKLKFQAFFCSLLERNPMDAREVTADWRQGGSLRCRRF